MPSAAKKEKMKTSPTLSELDDSSLAIFRINAVREDRAGARIKPQCEPFCSQPVSDHGAWTVRHWAAVNQSIVQCRHNVSARDGGFPASRRTGAGAFLCAPLRPLPRNAPPTTMTVHSSNPPCHRRADAVVLAAGDPPLIHGPATASGPASFYTTAGIPLKSQISNLKSGGTRLRLPSHLCVKK
jgi:hypothetical protein